MHGQQNIKFDKNSVVVDGLYLPIYFSSYILSESAIHILPFPTGFNNLITW
jgi:hypothetical protein